MATTSFLSEFTASTNIMRLITECRVSVVGILGTTSRGVIVPGASSAEWSRPQKTLATRHSIEVNSESVFNCIFNTLQVRVASSSLLHRGYFFSILPFRWSTLFRLIFRVIRLPSRLSLGGSWKVGGPFLSSSSYLSCRHVFCILYHRWYRFFVSPSIDQWVRMASPRFWALDIWLRTAEFGTNCGGSNCGELIN